MDVIVYKFPTTEELFDLSRSIVGDLIKNCEYPHLALSKIDDFINQCIPMLDETYRQVDEGIYIAKDAVVWDGATIVAPTIIGRKAEIRPGAFIRGGVIIGNGAVIGNSTEVKNSIIFDEAQLPHYNYVGDSIIGHRAHMGAGAIASNLRLDKSEVIISYGEYTPHHR